MVLRFLPAVLIAGLAVAADPAGATERRLYILNRTNATISAVSAVRSGDITKFAKPVSRERIGAGTRGQVTINDIYDSCTFDVVLDFQFGADVTRRVNICATAPLLVVTPRDRF